MKNNSNVEESAYSDYFKKTYPESIMVSHREYVTERCSKRKLFIYGTGTDAVDLTKSLLAMGIKPEFYIDDQCPGSMINDIKVIPSLDLVYEEADKIFVIVMGENDSYALSRQKFIDMGLLEDVDFTYHSELPSATDPYHYDVTLSFNRIRDKIEGFELYGDADNPNALKIVALGGSTTESTLHYIKGWVQYFTEYLRQNNISAVVYCGGVCAYTSSQELLKLIRDVIPLKPDIVLSYSGNNDLHLFPMPKDARLPPRPDGESPSRSAASALSIADCFSR